ncbi:MAG: hypothetical protein ACRD9R_09895, partial [Pyrinomonadaceae bacterium]
MRTLVASSHSSPQYLLSFAGGQPQVSLAHVLSFFSSAISTNLLIFVLQVEVAAKLMPVISIGQSALLDIVQG